MNSPGGSALSPGDPVLDRSLRTTLATDLDGTLIPLSHRPENRDHLPVLAELLQTSEMTLVFVTGRHFASVLNAIEEYNLPSPQWILCDVGTSAYERGSDGSFNPVDRYADVMQSIMQDVDQQVLLSLADSIEGLRRQPSRNQTRFKTSFFAPAELVDDVVAQIREQLGVTSESCQIISSIDPVTGEGLIDLLPAGVSKAFALDWWCREHDVTQHSVIFAGDSGNDLDAMQSGYRSIVVGNAAASVVENARQAHDRAGWTDRLFLAENHATSGVLEGLRHFTGSTIDPSR